MNQKQLVDLTMKKVKTAIIYKAKEQKKSETQIVEGLAKRMGITKVALGYKLSEPGRFKAIELKYLCEQLGVPFPNRLPDNLTKVKDIV